MEPPQRAQVISALNKNNAHSIKSSETILSDTATKLIQKADKSRQLKNHISGESAFFDDSSLPEIPQASARRDESAVIPLKEMSNEHDSIALETAGEMGIDRPVTPKPIASFRSMAALSNDYFIKYVQASDFVEQ